MLIDNPTNYLDLSEKELLVAYLQKKRVICFLCLWFLE
jgi:ATPase subunit of ABC transporter with duplicated ATPase domains